MVRNLNELALAFDKKKGRSTWDGASSIVHLKQDRNIISMLYKNIIVGKFTKK